MVIIHPDESGHDRISGTYAHGKLEQHLGFDIIEITDKYQEFGRDSQGKIIPKEGIYNAMFANKHCLFFLWKRDPIIGIEWAGLVIYSDDIPALEHCIEKYSTKSMII